MDRLKMNYDMTVKACFLGYIVQAIVNNFLPLLFLTLQSTYDIPLAKVTLLITVNFGLQLCVDLLSTFFVDRIGYRSSMILALAFSSAGFLFLSFLPDLMPSPYTGILIAVLFYAIGGGLLEVLVSPIVEACPTDNKETAMSMLHSFYCWGHVGVVLISTLFFYLAGIENWRIMARLWAIVPCLDLILFLFVPIASLIEEGEKGLTFTELVKNKLFWLLFILMLCAGASEQAVSQWASTFVEMGLNLGKTLGDLVGPTMFAFFMGLSRLFYGKYGERIDLRKFISGSAVLCLLSYLMIAFSPIAGIGVAGCALCGFSVGILWPGIFSTASASMRKGGTMLFALLALAGDLGCSGGPTYVGLISSAFDNDLKIGIGCAVIFPIMILIGMQLLKRSEP